MQVWDILEIPDQQIPVAGKLKRPAVMLNLVIDKMSQLLPILPIQAVDVSAVNIWKSGRGQNVLSLDRL